MIANERQYQQTRKMVGDHSSTSSYATARPARSGLDPLPSRLTR